MGVMGQANEQLPFCPGSVSMENPIEVADPLPETDFGPWMLVSRRRGQARGRGASSRAIHTSSGEAAVTRDGSNDSRSFPARNIRGGSQGLGRGGHHDSRDSRLTTALQDSAILSSGADLTPQATVLLLDLLFLHLLDLQFDHLPCLCQIPLNLNLFTFPEIPHLLSLDPLSSIPLQTL